MDRPACRESDDYERAPCDVFGRRLCRDHHDCGSSVAAYEAFRESESFGGARSIATLTLCVFAMTGAANRGIAHECVWRFDIYTRAIVNVTSMVA